MDRGRTTRQDASAAMRDAELILERCRDNLQDRQQRGESSERETLTSTTCQRPHTNEEKRSPPGCRSRSCVYRGEYVEYMYS